MFTLKKIRAAKRFQQLVQGVEPGDSRKIDNTNGAYMPLYAGNMGDIEVLIAGEHHEFTIHYLAHYGEQNGDLMNDPLMTFWTWKKDPSKIYPASYENHYVGVYREGLTVDETGRAGCRKALQADQTRFANTWLQNIASQQGV